MRTPRLLVRSSLAPLLLVAALGGSPGCGAGGAVATGGAEAPPLVAADPDRCPSAFAPILEVTNGTSLPIASVNVFISGTTTLLFRGPAPIAPGASASVQSNAMVGQFVTIVATYVGGTFDIISWPTQVLCNDYVFPIFL